MMNSLYLCSGNKEGADQLTASLFSRMQKKIKWFSHDTAHIWYFPYPAFADCEVLARARKIRLPRLALHDAARRPQPRPLVQRGQEEDQRARTDHAVP